ncbi:hypothetical protein BGX27_000601 [Mortierella sp. AM989]|nr:hypothetical protein BGX27_000601 [Mortierella sp. AM989]
MSNHPDNLEIYESVGPPPGIAAVSSSQLDSSENGSDMIAGMQDISTFGIAGRIWDSSYLLDVYLRRKVDQYTFIPPCPIPPEYFLQPKTTVTADSLISPSVSSSSPPQPPQPPIRILELGAGTGYVGITLAKRLTSDCTLILTDLEEVVPLMEKNVALHLPDNKNISASSPSSSNDTSRQCARVLVEPLAWGNSEHATKLLSQGKIDYIIASDLVYFPELYPPLLQTLKEVAVVGETKVLFGYKERAPWKESPFWEEFGRFFEIEVVRIEKIRNSKDESEDEDPVSVFGCEGGDSMYVFVATKRSDENILVGVDDTLTTLMMMQIGY